MTKKSKWVLVEDWLDLEPGDRVKAVKNGFYRAGASDEISTTVRTTVIREGLLRVIPGVGYTSTSSIKPEWVVYRNVRKATTKEPETPEEPTGEGYIYGFVRNEDGSEASYWRTPEGRWINHGSHTSWKLYFSVRPGSTFHRLVVG